MKYKGIIALFVIIVLVLNIIFYLTGQVSTLLFWIVLLVAGAIALLMRKK